MLRLVVVSLLVSSSCNLVRGPRRDHECRSTLRQIMALEFGFQSEQLRYTTHPHELGFAPSPGNRYLYLFDREGEVTRRDGRPSPAPAASVGYGPDTTQRGVTVEDLLPKLPGEVREQLGLSGTCPACQLIVGCVGNLDEDADVDVWTIATFERPGAARGTPLNFVSDL